MTFDVRQLPKSGPLFWPPPPHDPRERICLGRLDEWEIRIFARNDFKFEYFVRKKMLHLQLWHPLLCVSVLTPSLLTAGRFEVFPFRGWKYALPCLKSVNRILREKLGAPRIDVRLLSIIEHNLVHVETAGVLDQQDAQGNIPSNSIKLEG